MYANDGEDVLVRSLTLMLLETFSPLRRFYAAFENSVCDEYTTEKIVRSRHFMVPLVLNAAIAQRNRLCPVLS